MLHFNEQVPLRRYSTCVQKWRPIRPYAGGRKKPAMTFYNLENGCYVIYDVVHRLHKRRGC
jgi:hypothetical protein